MPTPNDDGKSGDREVLVIRGKLDRAGQFVLGRSRSTPNVHAWPVVEACDPCDPRDVSVETLDREARVLHRERALVRPEIGCEPGDARSFRVVAYIALRDDVDAVRLVRGDIELWRAPLPQAPELAMTVGRERVSRDKPVQLRLKFGPRGDGDHLTIVYRWGERRFRPVYIGEPAERLEIDLSELPGGDECRFVASYSNGLRSAHAATGYVRVPLLGASVTITAPDPRVPVVAGTPVLLQAAVRDDERPGGARHDDLTWHLDGKEVARGLVASIDGLAAGRRAVTLLYRETAAQAAIVLRVRAAEVATAADWPEWDPLDGNN